MASFNDFNSVLRIRALACCSLIAIAGGSAPAMAEAAADVAAAAPAASTDEIIVTGIRGSLRASAAIKREAPGILDAIASEDLGKFPDANVAESLQRIPGVTIDRSGGEGRFVTVRGFGPSFNTVLVNGRTFASDNVGREFSFDLLAAELISGAEVYKSSLARLQDGGIGATINVQTPRPLDLKNLQVIASAKGNYEQNSKKFTPQGFALVSIKNDAETLGLLVSGSYQKRDSRTPYVENRGYLPGSTVGPTGNPLFTNVFAPRNQDTGITTENRERIGVTATLQYKPADNVTLTLDGLYNQFNDHVNNNALGAWFEPSQYTAAQIDSNRTVTSLTTNGNADLIVSSANRFVKTRAVGFNAKWDVSDNLTVSYDGSWSRATDDAGGRNVFTVIGIPSRYSFTEAASGGFPSVTNFSADITNPNLGRTHIALRNGNDQSERVNEHRFDAVWKNEGGTVTAFRMGFVYTGRTKSSQLVQTNPNTLCLYCGYNTAAPASLLTPFSVGNFLSGGGSVPKNFQTYDANAYFAFLESPAAATALNNFYGLPPGTIAARLAATNGFAATPQASSFRVSENVYAGYADADFEGEIGSMPWFINVGARYVHTNVKAFGQQLNLLDLLPVSGDPTIYTGVFANGGTPVATTRTSSYDYLLPNINGRINLRDDVVARFAASRTLTRPQIADLAPRTNFDVLRPASLNASGGNPGLKPYTSDNFDLSFEWYPNKSSVFSVGLFYKRVKNFIVQTRANEVFTIANAGHLPVGGNITGPNEATFSVRRPRNQEELSVRGVELNASHTFDWLPGAWGGFGIAANATFVSSSAPFDQAATTQSFALEGLSNSQNVTVFYEKYGVSLRAAYNHRARFLQYLVTPGEGGDPVFVRPFQQVDVRAAYNFLEHYQVFFEGTNVLDAQNVTTGRFNNQVLSVRNTGARYAIGARVDF